MHSELGELQQEFSGQNAADRTLMGSFGLFFFGAIGLGLGLKELVFSQNAGGFLTYVMLGCAPFLFLAGFWIFQHANWLRSIAVQLFEEGFLVAFGERTFSFRWEAISRVDETIDNRRGTAIWNVLVTRNDGESFGFGEYMFDDADELRKAIQERSLAMGIPWQTKSDE